MRDAGHLGYRGLGLKLAGLYDLAEFRRFQVQPAQRGCELHAQLRRCMGTRARRKIRYGTLLAAVLALDRMPGPLAALLAHLDN